MCVLDPQMDRKAEITTEIVQNSGISFADPRLLFCESVSHVIRKIWGNFQGKIGSESMCNNRPVLSAAGSY